MARQGWGWLRGGGGDLDLGVYKYIPSMMLPSPRSPTSRAELSG